jgi:hypothetical protein
MKYRKWDPKTKAKIVLEGLQNNQPLSELCNNYQISQNQYYNCLNFQVLTCKKPPAVLIDSLTSC